ncbi:glutamate receptor ionotropic, delta-2-like [Macrobrachium nipponense]|uniref:glutamate receptor ionotropic, delta-2-like n=1 Tax=Macrobrachium nipponense TaxID=159736 RepID=UPI0030C8BDFA
MFPVMRNNFSTILAFMVLGSGSWPRDVTRSQDFLRTNPNATESIMLPGPRYSNISVDDVFKLVRVFPRNDNRGLIVLYGQEYEEVMKELPQLLAAEFVVLMKMENDGKTETLRRIFALSSGKNFLLLLDTPANIISTFKMMRKKMLRTYMVKWVLLMEGSDANSGIKALEEFVNEGAQVTIIVKTADGLLNYHLPSIDTYGVTRFKNNGQWENTKDLKEILSKEPQKPYSLSGRHFKVAVKDLMMMITVGRVYPDGSVELVAGAETKVLAILSSVLNFTYKAYLSPDNGWGSLLPDGNVTGVVGMVARREVAIGFAGLSYADNRMSVVDVTAAYHTGRYLVMSRSPKQKNKALSILSPFGFEIWVCIILSVALMGPVVYIMSHLLNKFVGADVKMDFQWFQFNTFRNIVNQGNLMTEDALQIRVVLLFWFFFCAVNAALYSGMLTAALAIPAYETPIDSLQDLPRAVKEGFTVGTLGASNYEDLFKSATEGVLKQTWDLFNHEDRSKSFVANMYAGAKRALEEKFAFITSDSFARVFSMMFGEDKFHLSKQKIFPSNLGGVCQKGSPVADRLSSMVLRMIDSGLIDKMAEDAYRAIKTVRTVEETENISFAITLNHLQAAFYFYFLGLIASTLALLMERIKFHAEGKTSSL